MKKNKKGFSLILVVGLVLVVNLLAIGILEYIIPFSRDTKNIENSVVSYYQAETGIEDALFYLSKNNFEPGTESGNTLDSSVIDSAFKIIGTGSVLPPTGRGNSEYDSDWNQISFGNPIQLEIGSNNVDFGVAEFAFRVPKLNELSTLTLSGSSTLPIVNWQISSADNSLNADGEYIFSDQMCNSNETYGLGDCDLIIDNFQGIDLNGDNGTNEEIGNYYTVNCTTAGSGCILKLSVINKLETTSGLNVPYLEWRIDFGNNAPLRYSIIETEGKAYGYKKDLQIRVPQQTTNEAFDFTVFQ